MNQSTQSRLMIHSACESFSGVDSQLSSIAHVCAAPAVVDRPSWAHFTVNDTVIWRSGPLQGRAEHGSVTERTMDRIDRDYRWTMIKAAVSSRTRKRRRRKQVSGSVKPRFLTSLNFKISSHDLLVQLTDTLDLIPWLRFAFHFMLVINTELVKLARVFLLLLAFGKLASMDIDLVHRLPFMLTDF